MASWQWRHSTSTAEGISAGTARRGGQQRRDAACWHPLGTHPGQPQRGKPPVVIPTSTDANIEFHRDGTAEANDGVNGLDADYTATTTTITLHNPMVGAVGYSGGDPALDATTRSLGDVFDQGDA